jgi:Flp pilus assembly protein TadG
MNISKMQNALRTFTRDRSGGPATEFALVFPVMLLLLLGIIEFGLTLNNYVMLTYAVASGAQQFALSAPEPGVTQSSGCPDAAQTSPALNAMNCPYSAALTTIQQAAPMLTWSTLSGNLTFKVNGTACATDAACFTALQTAAASSTLTSATVYATYPCTLQLLAFQGHVPSCNLGAQTTEAVQ